MQDFLKCDAKGCKHAELVDEITSSMIGRKCPLCGSNLLTEADYTLFASVIELQKELDNVLYTHVHDNTVNVILSASTNPNQPKEI